MHLPAGHRAPKSPRFLPSSFVRILSLVFSLLGLTQFSSCEQAGGPTVIVNFTGAPSGAAVLKLRATLNGNEVRPADELSPTLEQTAYPLTVGQSGTFSVAARVLDASGCAMAMGHADATIMGTAGERVIVTVAFLASTPPLCTVEVHATGNGTVTSNPTGLTCGQQCSLDVPAGTKLALLATPSDRAYFGGWQGACAGTGPCEVMVTRPISVGAAFYPQLCTSSICWESPQPTNISLWAIWGSATNNLFAVGDSGQILHYDGTAWSLMSVPVSANLRAVWGSSDKDVWAVGEGATIVHYDGTAWSAVMAPAGSTNNLFGLSGTGPSDVWAVGDAGAALHFDGTDWSSMTTTIALTAYNLYGVYVSANEFFVVTSNGQLFRKTGTTFASVGNNSGQVLYAISGADDSSIIGVGDNSSALVWDGTAATRQAAYPGSFSLRGVHARAKNDAWIVGAEGALLHWNGTALSRMNAPTNQTLQAVFAVSEKDVWAVGTRGALLHFDGTSVTPYGGSGFPDFGDLRSVSGTSANDLWAVGGDTSVGNIILHNSGQGWVPVPTGQLPTVIYRGVYAVSPTEVWVIGNNNITSTSVILRWNGQSFSAVSGLSTTLTLNAIGGSGSNNIWIGGNAGFIYKWNGSTFMPIAAGTMNPPQILSIAAVSPTEVWLGCAPTMDGVLMQTVGCILHYNGSSMTLLRGPPTVTFNAAAIAASNDIWFAGLNTSPMAHGVALHVQNGAIGGVFDLSNKYPEFFGIGVRSSNDIWVSGRFGSLVHTTDMFTTHSAISTGLLSLASMILYGITPAGASGMVAVGTGHTILRLLP